MRGCLHTYFSDSGTGSSRTVPAWLVVNRFQREPDGRYRVDFAEGEEQRCVDNSPYRWYRVLPQVGVGMDIPTGTANGSTARSACVVNGRLRQEGEGAFRPAPPYQRARPRTALPGRAAPAAATIHRRQDPRDREGQPAIPLPLWRVLPPDMDPA